MRDSIPASSGWTGGAFVRLLVMLLVLPIAARGASAQGPAMDIGGYYQPDEALAAKAMRPSETLNGILASL